jgi:hypothetical protein
MAPDAPVALAEETATLAAAPTAPVPESIATTPPPTFTTEVLEVVEAEIVTMGHSEPLGEPPAAPPPKSPRRKRGPKKSKQKPGEV